MNVTTENSQLSILSAQHILFVTDYYADFVRSFIKWFKNKEEKRVYKILDKSYNGYVVKNEHNHTIGYVTYQLKPELHEKYMMNPKSMRFFLQPNSFSYAQMEVVNAMLSQNFEAILKENNAYLTSEDMNTLIKNVIFLLIDDFIL